MGDGIFDVDTRTSLRHVPLGGGAVVAVKRVVINFASLGGFNFGFLNKDNINLIIREEGSKFMNAEGETVGIPIKDCKIPKRVVCHYVGGGLQ